MAVCRPMLPTERRDETWFYNADEWLGCVNWYKLPLCMYYAEKLKSKGAEVKTFNTSDLACMELKNKGVDAVISDRPVLQYFLAQGGNAYAKMVGKALSAEDYGIVISKKHPELQKALDKSLDNLKQNGTYDKLYEKWFGEKPAK